MPEPLTGFEDIVFHIERGDLVDILEHPKPGRYAGQRLSLTMHRITDPTRELVVDVDGEPATVVLDPLFALLDPDSVDNRVVVSPER